MEFTDTLKTKIKTARTEEEVKNTIEETRKNVADAGVILNDAEFDNAAGGDVMSPGRPKKNRYFIK